MSWPISADGEYYEFEGVILIPVDPSTGVAQLLLRPQGGLLVGVPAIEQGDPGQHAEIDTTINFTALAYDDVTPDSASWTEITPPDDETPGVWRLNLALHNGAPGDDSTTAIDLDTIDGLLAEGRLIKVNATLDGFEYTSEKCGDSYIPAAISNTGSGNPNSTIATVSVPAQDFDWRPAVFGYTVVTGESADVRVDLVARLDSETDGNIVAHCVGAASTERLTFSPVIPAGSADTYDRVDAGAAAVIYVRCERQTGSVTYTTSASTSRFSVRVCPIPGTALEEGS